MHGSGARPSAGASAAAARSALTGSCSKQVGRRCEPRGRICVLDQSLELAPCQLGAQGAAALAAFAPWHCCSRLTALSIRGGASAVVQLDDAGATALLLTGVVSQLSGLKRLQLANIGLFDDNIEHLPKALRALSHLMCIDLRHNARMSARAIFVAVCCGLRCCSKLCELALPHGVQARLTTLSSLLLWWPRMCEIDFY